MKRLAIIDDNPIILKTLSAFLKTDFLCETFLKPKETLHFLSLEKVDLILLDVHMPEIDGLTFLRILNERDLSSY